jgi:excinuclease ABC subunit C
MPIDKSQIKLAPKTPGVYFYKDDNDKIIYIGKAINLYNRLNSYLQKNIDEKTKQMLFCSKTISWQETETNLEALILEANLIKKYKPHYNIKQKDDKSFIYIYITKEDFPRVFLDRPNKLQAKSYKSCLSAGRLKASFGPYTSTQEARLAYKILRKIFLFRDSPESKFKLYQKKVKPCLFYSLKLCSAPCANFINKIDYNKSIKNLINFLKGNKKSVIKKLQGEMKEFSKNQKFERATETRNAIFALNHIHDTALIKNDFEANINTDSNPNDIRIECYDISNLPAGRQVLAKYAVGSMVVFTNGKPNKNEYRKFKIKSVNGANDIAMIKEVLTRRLAHTEWAMPGLIIIDGGKAHFNIAKNTVSKYNLSIPVVAVAKGPKRDKLDIYSDNKLDVDIKIIEQARNEAHRFAITYHKKLRGKQFIK